MRNGQNNKRMRNRNRKGQNPMTRVYESNGPEVKIRGTASHVAEKYLQLARDAQGSGDPVGAENYYQHAEHYFRIIAAAQEQFRQTQPSFYRNEGGEMRDDGGDDGEGDDGFQPYGEPYSPQQNYQQQPQQREQPYQRNEQPRNEQGGYQQRSQQPQPQVADNGDVDRLPSFITGAQPQPDINGGNGSGNGYHQDRGDRGDRGGDRGERGDRFNHRRRRRHHSGPRSDNHNQASNGGDFVDNAGE